MDNQKIIKVTRKLADIVNREFPHVFVHDAREALARTLFGLHFEPEILGRLFDDCDYEISAKMRQCDIGDNLV